MPVIEVDLKDLAQLVDWDSDEGKLLEILPYLGLDIESVEGSTVRVEYSPNRPDYATLYGIAASLDGILGRERGALRHEVKGSDVVFLVGEGVRRIRPYIAGILATGLRLHDVEIKMLMRLQEDLHEGVGRKRRKVAIGLHDADHVKPPIRYTTVDGDFKFVPLGESREWAVEEVLNKHPNGIRYGAALGETKRYPLLMDSERKTLSLPPIINGGYTMLAPGAGRILVDITGTSLRRVLDAASVLAVTLAEMGAELHSVAIRYADIEMQTPDLSITEMELDPREVNRLLGLELTQEEIVESLLKARLDADVMGTKLLVRIPRYRFDVMHEVDLIEEVAYGLGYERMTPSYDLEYTTGELQRSTMFKESIRRAVIGLGFQEVLTTDLTSYERLYSSMGREPENGTLRVVATKSSEYEYLRDTLVPGLLWVLSSNTHEEYPHRIFEIGTVVIDEGAGRIGEGERLAIGIAHSRSSFTEVKSTVESLFKILLGREPDYVPHTTRPYSEGRAASMILDRRNLGILGEIHPAVLDGLKIQVPVAAAELDLDALEEMCTTVK